MGSLKEGCARRAIGPIRVRFVGSTRDLLSQICQTQLLMLLISFKVSINAPFDCHSVMPSAWTDL